MYVQTFYYILCIPLIHNLKVFYIEIKTTLHLNSHLYKKGSHAIIVFFIKHTMLFLLVSDIHLLTK